MAPSVRRSRSHTVTCLIGLVARLLMSLLLLLVLLCGSMQDAQGQESEKYKRNVCDTHSHKRKNTSVSSGCVEQHRLPTHGLTQILYAQTCLQTRHAAFQFHSRSTVGAEKGKGAGATAAAGVDVCNHHSRTPALQPILED